MEDFENRVRELEMKIDDMKAEVAIMKICYGIALVMLGMLWLGVIK